MSDEQGHEDRMGRRFDETRKAIATLQQRLDDDQRYFELNPHRAFTEMLPPLCNVLWRITDRGRRLNRIRR